MFLRLFFLFTIVPAVELFLLIKVGQKIGAGNTILLILFTGLLGAFYARQQGLRVMSNIQWKVDQGQVPGDDLINGAMLLVGGALLITPGFITDLLGFSLIFPLTREVLKGFVKKQIDRKIREGRVRFHRY
ncbi:MAG: membrane protein FxsA [Proteobacteria bacterium]|nr:membrane protein FxsA [Pseudomonadota bacterium]